MKQNRRFQYADIQKGLRFERLEDSFFVADIRGVSIPVYMSAFLRKDETMPVLEPIR